MRDKQTDRHKLGRHRQRDREREKERKYGMQIVLGERKIIYKNKGKMKIKNENNYGKRRKKSFDFLCSLFDLNDMPTCTSMHISPTVNSSSFKNKFQKKKDQFSVFIIFTFNDNFLGVGWDRIGFVQKKVELIKIFHETFLFHVLLEIIKLNKNYKWYQTIKNDILNKFFISVIFFLTYKWHLLYFYIQAISIFLWWNGIS